MQYRVEVRVRGLVPKVVDGVTHMIKGDVIEHVTVDVPDSTPRDLQAAKARGLAVDQVLNGVPAANLSHTYLSCHDTTPICPGDGNPGNGDVESGRMPLKGRRGDFAKTAQRIGGRFVKAA